MSPLDGLHGSLYDTWLEYSTYTMGNTIWPLVHELKRSRGDTSWDQVGQEHGDSDM
jgi:hypothetical protein